MPPEQVDAMENEMFGTPFTGINRFATRDPVQQEESSRRITTSQTAQQAVEPIRPNFTRQQPPLQTITIPPPQRPPDRRRNSDGTTWGANQFFSSARPSSAAATNIDPETSTATAEPSSAAAAATQPEAQELQDQSASIHDALATLAAVAAQGTDGGEAMNTLIALASHVLDDEQDAAAPRRSRTPQRAAPKRAAPKRAAPKRAEAVAVPATGRAPVREELEGRVEAAPTRGTSREKV